MRLEGADMSYARILVVSHPFSAEADHFTRIYKALCRLGHAVTLVDPYRYGANHAEQLSYAMQALRARCERFGPSLILWDARLDRDFKDLFTTISRDACIRIEQELSVDSKVLFYESEYGLSAMLPAFQDKSYRQAVCSWLNEERGNRVLLVQAVDDERKHAIERMIAAGENGMTQKSPFPLFAEVVRLPEQDRGIHFELGFESRMSRYCLVFDCEDVPSFYELIRHAEAGCVLGVEESLLQSWQAHRNVQREQQVALQTEIAGAPSKTSDVLDVVDLMLPLSLDAQTSFLGNEELSYEQRERQERWLDSLIDIEALLENLLVQAKQKLSASVAPLANPAKSVVIYGWLGKENFGDDFLLELVSTRVHERYPQAVVMVVAADAEVVERQFGFEAVTPGCFAEMDEMFKRSAALIFFGGLINDEPMMWTAGCIETFMNPWIEPSGQAAACLLAWLRGTSIFHLGVGMGPLDKPAAREALRLIALAGARFLLRDIESAQLSIEAGVNPDQIRPIADLAVSSRPLIEKRLAQRQPELPAVLRDKPYVVVSMREWPLNPNAFCENVAQALSAYIEATDNYIAFIPFDPEDDEIHSKIVDLMEPHPRILRLHEKPDFDLMLRIVEQSRSAFAMRLHCSILHHVMGKPAVGLDYNNKVGAHFRQVEQEVALMSLDASADEFARRLIDTEKYYDEIGEAIANRVAQLSAEVAVGFEELYRAFEAYTPDFTGQECYYPRKRSKLELDIQWERKDLNAKIASLEERVCQRDAEIEAVRCELQTLQESKAYRFGNAFAAGPRAVRRLFSRDSSSK